MDVVTNKCISRYFAMAILLVKFICRWTEQYVVFMLFSREIVQRRIRRSLFATERKIIRLTLFLNKMLAK
jgi:hypothetical protein